MGLFPKIASHWFVLDEEKAKKKSIRMQKLMCVYKKKLEDESHAFVPHAKIGGVWIAGYTAKMLREWINRELGNQFNYQLVNYRTSLEGKRTLCQFNIDNKDDEHEMILSFIDKEHMEMHNREHEVKKCAYFSHEIADDFVKFTELMFGKGKYDPEWFLPHHRLLRFKQIHKKRGDITEFLNLWKAKFFNLWTNQVYCLNSEDKKRVRKALNL